MKRKVYERYKPSGVEWLGEIPEHWAIRRLKYCTTLTNVKVDGGESDLPYTGLEHIESWTGKRTAPSDGSPNDGQASAHRTGDVLFGKLRPYLAKVHVAEEDGICSGELLVLRSKTMLQTFLRDYLLNPDFISTVDSSTYGAKMPRANWDFIGNMATLVPPAEEQQAISAFLDRETSRIDELIAKKQRQIEILQEKRSALISHVVTKGLDPDVKMKDSGIEWLGEIPEHWGAIRFKFLLDEPLQYGANESAEYDETAWPRYVRITDINENGNLREETFKSLPEDIAQPYLLRDGDLLLARSGATVGKTFLYLKSWGRAAYAGYLIRARLEHKCMLPTFCSYFCRSNNYWDWLKSSFIQATIQNVSAERYANMVVPRPPIDEQQAIMAFLDRETSHIDELTEKVKKSIDLLREYRTALISAAVTGKINVREEAPAS